MDAQEIRVKVERGEIRVHFLGYSHRFVGV
jgi:hypothetical protein